MAIQIFERTEKKYLISGAQRAALLALADGKLCTDRFFKSTICSLYFDTETYRLIRDSMEKPLYKEKLRLRCYGQPSADSMVFLELKKKFDGVVYKRREQMTLQQAQQYFKTGQAPKDTQIMHEIDWMLHHYEGLRPMMLVAYDREAFRGVQDATLRLTLDDGLRYRTKDLLLEHGSYGRPILTPDQFVLEIKALGALPLWLAQGLDQLSIFPASFSKYGSAYALELAAQPQHTPNHRIA